MYAVLLQEQAQAARQRAAGTMDEYTFIAEDSEAADQAGSVPAMQQVSAEELYRKELAEEMQVQLLYKVNHFEAAALMLMCISSFETRNKDVLWSCIMQPPPKKMHFGIGIPCSSCVSSSSALQNQMLATCSPS